MPKNVMEDMVKIKIVKKNITIKKIEDKIIPNIPLYTPPPNNNYIKKEKTQKKGPGFKIWIVALFSLVFLFLSLSYIFSKAEISIDPRIEDRLLDENLFANKDSTSSELSFDLVVISGEENQNIETKEKKNVENRARGSIMLYNKFSTKTQTLLIDTQLEGSNGKIYKTNKKIIVPGMAKDGTPGKIEVGIYGVSAGEEYNSPPLDFKIKNFKSTPKYTTIYGRSKGNITGGIKGDFYIIGGDEKDKVIGTMKENLEGKLLKKATEQIPKGFILFKDAVFLNLTDIDTDFFSKDAQVPVGLKGTLYGFLLDENKLTKKIAKDAIEEYDDSDIYISNLKDLVFSLVGKENISFSDVKNINFTLKGPANFVWKFDDKKFITELVGKSKSDFSFILSKYSNIFSSNLIIKPFWRRSFPNKIENIKIIVNYPK